MKVLKKIRSLRADVKQPATVKGDASCDVNGNRKYIFRGKGSGLQRTASIVIPQSVTWTMSEEESMASTKNSHTAVVNVLEQPTLNHKAFAELEEMHHADLAEKEWEIAQIKDALEDKLTKMKIVIQELKAIHQDELAEKDEEIAQMKASLKETEYELAHAIVELSRKQDMLDDTEVALVEREMELDETKEQLVVVIRTLMVHQDKLHAKEEELKALKSFVNIGKGVLSGFFSAF